MTFPSEPSRAVTSATFHVLSVLGGVSAALALTYLVFGHLPWFIGGSSSLGEPVLDGHVTAETRHYFLQAPTSQALKHARRGLENAVSSTQDKFGGAPRRSLLVVIVNDIRRLSEIDVQAYRNQGIHVLPFVSKASFQSSLLNPSDRFVLDVGRVVTESDGAVRVSRAFDVKDAPEIDLRRGDAIQRINGTQVETLDSFRRAFEEIPTGGTVSLTVLREEERVSVRYQKHSGNAPVGGQKETAPRGRSWYASTLAHEACHLFVVDYADRYYDGRQGAQSRRSYENYGHVALPDWLDEAAATLCEGADMKANRYRRLRDQLDDPIPLRKLFTMAHPLSTNLADVDSSEGDAAPIRFRTGERVGRAAKETRTGLFYAQALAVGEFIYARGGSDALGAMTKHFAKGGSLEAALRKAAHSSDLPSSVDSLQTEWVRWVASSSTRRSAFPHEER